ncbi:hypothetical protein ACLOJK_007784 [Asimina triloba]
MMGKDVLILLIISILSLSSLFNFSFISECRPTETKESPPPHKRQKHPHSPFPRIPPPFLPHNPSIALKAPVYLSPSFFTSLLHNLSLSPFLETELGAFSFEARTGETEEGRKAILGFPHPPFLIPTKSPFSSNDLIGTQMGFSKSPSFSSLLLFLPTFALLLHPNVAEDLSALLFKGCSQQSFSSNGGGFQQTLSTLFDYLVSQSATTRFSKTSTGSGQNAGSALFQCRGDLSNTDCARCVSMMPTMSSTLCGNAVAARIQLVGCYASYQIAGFPQIPGTQLLFKKCSSALGNFEEKRDTAFAAVETGVTGGSGFYATTYGSVYAFGQCEGDLSVGDCGQCMKEAAEKAGVECGQSVAGQIFLNRCYLTYRYGSGGGGGGGGGVLRPSSPSGSDAQQTGKTVAIVLGGAAALGFAVICLLFLRSLMKKHDDHGQMQNVSYGHTEEKIWTACSLDGLHILMKGDHWKYDLVLSVWCLPTLTSAHVHLDGGCSLMHSAVVNTFASFA